MPQPQPKPCRTYGARHFSFDLSEEGALVRLELRPVCLDESGFAAISSAAKKQQNLARFRKLSAEIDDGSCERLFYHIVARGLARLYMRHARAAFRAAGIRGLTRKARRACLRHGKRPVHKVMASCGQTG